MTSSSRTSHPGGRHGWGSTRDLSDIVYSEITGYGVDGPYAQKYAYDLVVQGEAGLIAMTGTPDEPARIAIPVCDIGAGSYAAIRTLAALLRRAATGEGELVSVSLFDVMLDWIGYYPPFWWHRGEAPERTGMRHPLFCPYGPSGPPTGGWSTSRCSRRITGGRSART